MINPPLKASILKMSLTNRHYKTVSIAHASVLDDDSSAVNIHSKRLKAVELRVMVKAPLLAGRTIFQQKAYFNIVCGLPRVLIIQNSRKTS